MKENFYNAIIHFCIKHTSLHTKNIYAMLKQIPETEMKIYMNIFYKEKESDNK